MLTPEKLSNMSLKMYTNSDYSQIVNGRKGCNDNNSEDLNDSRLLQLEDTIEELNANNKKAYKKGNQKVIMNSLSTLPILSN